MNDLCKNSNTDSNLLKKIKDIACSINKIVIILKYIEMNSTLENANLNEIRIFIINQVYQNIFHGETNTRSIYFEDNRKSFEDIIQYVSSLKQILIAIINLMNENKILTDLKIKWDSILLENLFSCELSLKYESEHIIGNKFVISFNLKNSHYNNFLLDEKSSNSEENMSKTEFNIY